MRKLALALAAAAILVVAAGPASAISLGGIRNSLVQWVLDKISVEGVFEINVEEVIGDEDRGTTLVGVEISDGAGVWFTAERLSFDFNKTRLLRGQLFIENLALDEVEIFRQPVIPEGEGIEVDLEGVEVPPDPDTPFYWPRSPITAAIENLSLAGVHLHQEVLGQELRFDATGSFRDQGDVQEAALELRRTDQVEGLIDFDYSRNFEENTLALNLDAAEAAGGIVSELAGLPPEVPVRVSLKADGTPDAFATNFDLALTDYIEAQGTATIDYAGPLSVDATFVARPGRLLPPEYAQLIGEQAELVVRASEGPDQTVQIQTARITSPYLQATVDGTYSRATGAVDAAVELIAEPGLADPFPGIRFDGLRFAGQVQGVPGALSADGDLVLQGLVTPQVGVETATLEIDVTQSGPAEAPVTELSAEGRVTGLRLDKIGPDVIGEARIELAATMEGDEVLLEAAVVDSQPLNLTASGTANVATGDFSVDYGLAAPDLGPILSAYGIPGTGRIDGSGKAVSEAGVLTVTTTVELADFVTDFASAGTLRLYGTVVQSAERTTFNLAGAGERLGIGELGPDILDRADLIVAGALDGDVLTLDTARIDSPVLDAAADGQVNLAASTGRIQFRAEASDLSPVADAYGYDLSGEMVAEGAAILRPEGVAVQATADATDLSGDIDTQRLHVEASVDQSGDRIGFSVTADSPGLTVELEGQELSGPVDLAVEGALAGELLTLDIARIASPVLTGAVEGRLYLADLTGLINYDIDSARLAALAPLLGVEASGVLSAAGTADLGETSADPIPAVQGTAAIADLSVMGTFIGDLAASYDVSLPGDLPAGTLRLELTQSPFAPDAPTVVSLTMSGPDSAWQLALDVDAPNYLDAGGRATVAWEDPLAVSASFFARPGPKLPAEYAQLIGEEATLVVEAAEDQDGTIRIETARIASPVLNAQVSGSYAPDSGAADLRVSLAAEPELAAPFEGIDFDGLSFEGQVSGAPGSLRADGSLVLEGFASEQLSLDRAALDIDIGQTGTAEAPVTDIALSGTVDGLAAAGVGAETVGQARIRFDGTLAGDELAIETARIDSELLQLWAKGTANVATMEFDLDYNLATPAIAPLAQAFGIEASGAVSAAGSVLGQGDRLAIETRAELTNLTSPYADAQRLAVQGEVSQQGDRLAFDVTGTGTGLRIDQIGPELLGDASFAATGSLDGDVLALETFRVSSPVIKATAEGTVNLASGEGRLEYRVGEVALGVLGPVYDLPLTGTGSATGVLGLANGGAAGPRLVGEARVAGLAYAGTQVGDAVLTHDVVLSDTPAGTLDLALTAGPYAPARIETAFRLDGQRLVLDGLQARGFGVTASGDLVVNLDTLAAEGPLRVRMAEGPFAGVEATARVRYQGNRLVLGGLRAQGLGITAAGDVTMNTDTLLAEGTLRLDGADLAALEQTLGTPVTGQASGTVRLMPEGGRQTVALDLSLAGLNAFDAAIGSARLEGRIADALGTPRLDLALDAQQIVSGGIALATLRLTAQGPLSGVEIALDGTGEMGRDPLVLSAAARADLAGATTRATVSRLLLSLGQDRVELLSPLTVTARGSAVHLQDMAIALPDGGRLTGDVAYYGGPLAGDIVLDAPDLAFVSRLFDVPVEGGALRVAGIFDTRRGSAGADIDITGREIVVEDLSGAGVLSLDASIDWNGRILDLDARVQGNFEQPLVITASVPVVATGGLPALAERGPVSARIDWEGEIGDIWALVPAPGHVLTGDAKIDLGVSGDISSPIFTGGILLADGVYQNLDYGTILTGLSLATTVDAGALGLRLDAVDGAQGAVIVEGSVGFGDSGIDLTVETRRAIVVRRDDAVVRVDADMRIFQEPDGRMAVTGTVAILEAEVRLVNANPPSIVTLGEVRIKGEPIEIEGDGLSLPIALNIDVNAPGRIFVRGRGLDSEWRMDLAVRGTAAVPRITGEIEAVRGELDLLGREFDLERGRVQFNGGPVIDPRLDVSLVRETDDITGRILVTGSAFDPELSFTSAPSLPEDEVLPRLLFGTSSQALTPAQGIQLALGLATLLNGGGGTLDQVRAAVGLDSLDFEQDDDGLALEVGKEVTERVWVGTRQSLEGGGTTVAVEVDVFENVDAYGEVGTDGDTSVGLKWKKDF